VDMVNEMKRKEIEERIQSVIDINQKEIDKNISGDWESGYNRGYISALEWVLKGKK